MYAIEFSGIALALVVSVIAPGVMLIGNAWVTSKQKREDWARQDAVEARAKQASDDLLASTRENARFNAENARTNAEAVVQARANQETQERKLKEIKDLSEVTHALVNSDMTASMRARRDNLAVMVVLMKEVVDSKEAAGVAPSPEALAAIVAIHAEIAALDRDIEERVRGQHTAEIQARHDGEPQQVVIVATEPVPVTVVGAQEQEQEPPQS